MNIILAIQTIENLISEYLDNSWSVVTNQSYVNVGLCNPVSKQIIISEPIILANDEEIVNIVGKHEIAHVLAGPWHNRRWKNKAIELGIPPYAKIKINQPVGNWKAICPKCQKILYMYCKPKTFYYHEPCGKEAKLKFEENEK